MEYNFNSRPVIYNNKIEATGHNPAGFSVCCHSCPAPHFQR